MVVCNRCQKRGHFAQNCHVKIFQPKPKEPVVKNPTKAKTASWKKKTELKKASYAGPPHQTYQLPPQQFHQSTQPVVVIPTVHHWHGHPPSGRGGRQHEHPPPLLPPSHYHPLLEQQNCPPPGGHDYPTARGVYAIIDNNGRVYVGKSNNVKKRIEEHKCGQGTKFLHFETIRQLPTCTPDNPSDFESWERSETSAQMYKNGIDMVRGWMFTSSDLPECQKQSAFEQICEKFDLCRKCGRDSHFVDKCFAKSIANWAR